MRPSKLTAQGEHFQTCPAFLNSFISSDWIISPEYFYLYSLMKVSVHFIIIFLVSISFLLFFQKKVIIGKLLATEMNTFNNHKWLVTVWLIGDWFAGGNSITENNRNTSVALTDHIRAVWGSLWTKSFTSEETALWHLKLISILNRFLFYYFSIQQSLHPLSSARLLQLQISTIIFFNPFSL